MCMLSLPQDTKPLVKSLLFFYRQIFASQSEVTFDPVDVRIELFKAEPDLFDLNKNIGAYDALDYIVNALNF